MEITDVVQIGVLQNGVSVYLFQLGGKQTLGLWADEFFNAYPDLAEQLSGFVVDNMLPITPEVTQLIPDYNVLYDEILNMYNDYAAQNTPQTQNGGTPNEPLQLQ